MKFVITTAIAILLLDVAFGQSPSDTIRIYNYLNPTENWKIEIKNEGKFSLYSNDLFVPCKIISMGRFETSDTEIRFICDTPSLKEKPIISEQSKQISNEASILLGDSFRWINHYFIPNNIILSSGGDYTISKGITGRYLRGDGFGNIIIEINGDGTYKITDYSCTSMRFQKGKWTINSSEIVLNPFEKGESLVTGLTMNMRFYITENYLIGRKQNKSKWLGKSIATETYYYLARLPDYQTD